MFITVLPETSKVKEGIKRAFRDADKDAAEAGRRWGKEAERGMGEIKPKVKPDTVSAEAELAKFRTEQERRKIRQKIEFDEADLKGKLEIIGKQFDGVAAKFASPLKLSLGLATVGAGLPALATGLVDVAGAAQQLAGAGLALPGVFSGIFSSVGTAALGMQGMKDALDAVSKASDGTQKSVDAANKALAALAPNQAEAVKTVAGLKGTLTDLEHIAGQNMFAGFSTGLQTLVGNLLPAATRGIDGISRAINQNLLQAMRSLGSGSSQGFLDRIFGNTADAQGRLTRAIDPVIHAFGVLGAAGSDSLPRLATAVGTVAERFNKFITSADADGRLSRWIDEGLTGLTQLGNIALNLAKSFTAITQAAGTGGFLTTIESATQKLQTFLNSTQGQETMKQFFDDGRILLGQLRDLCVQLGPLLPAMFDGARISAGLWLPVITEILRIINAIPGGAQAVVVAFLAWRTISGVSALATALGSVATLLSTTLPAAATAGAGGISTALAGVTVPAWLTFLVAGGSVAAVGSGLSRDHQAGLSPEINTRYPYLRNPRGGAGGGGFTGGGGGSFATPAPPLTRSALDRIHGTDAEFGTLPTPVATPPVTPIAPSSFTPPVVTQSSGGGKSGSIAPPLATPSTPAGVVTGGTRVAALYALANSLQGTPYSQALRNDCSGMVAQLASVAVGLPAPSAAQRFTTVTEQDWLLSHGFQMGRGGPGDLRIGWNPQPGNAGHTAATLPGGEHAESGGSGGGFRVGPSAAGADSPQFSMHAFLPMTGAAGSAAANSPNTPMYVAYAPEQYQQYKPGQGDQANQLGQAIGSDLMSSILPDGFKNPFQTGGWKFVSGLLNGLMGIKLPQGSVQGGDGASLGGGGGGGLGGLLSGLTGLIPQPFGPVQSGSPGNAPGSFMPLMPNPADAQISPFQVTGPPGGAGPGNQVNNNQLVINNPVGQDHLTNMVNTAQQAQVPRVRQGVRPLPS